MHFAGDWQSDSVALKTRQFLHRLLEDQMKTALVLLHKEILDFAERWASLTSWCDAWVHVIRDSTIFAAMCYPQRMTCETFSSCGRALEVCAT